MRSQPESRWGLIARGGSKFGSRLQFFSNTQAIRSLGFENLLQFQPSQLVRRQPGFDGLLSRLAKQETWTANPERFKAVYD